MLLGAERLRRRAPGVRRRRADQRRAHRATMSWRQALGIGAAQAIALIPGFSRSGATMGGGLLVGLSNEDAARFAFLLATPIIGAAALLKLPDLFGHKGDGVRGPALVAALCAAVTAYRRRALPAALLRDQPADVVRLLLHRRRRGVHPDLRVRRLRHTRSADAPPGRRGRAQDGRADRARAARGRPRRRRRDDRRGCAVARGPVAYDAIVLDVMPAGHRRVRDLQAAARRRDLDAGAHAHGARRRRRPRRGPRRRRRRLPRQAVLVRRAARSDAGAGPPRPRRAPARCCVGDLRLDPARREAWRGEHRDRPHGQGVRAAGGLHAPARARCCRASPDRAGWDESSSTAPTSSTPTCGCCATRSTARSAPTPSKRSAAWATGCALPEQLLSALPLRVRLTLGLHGRHGRRAGHRVRLPVPAHQGGHRPGDRRRAGPARARCRRGREHRRTPPPCCARPALPAGQIGDIAQVVDATRPRRRRDPLGAPPPARRTESCARRRAGACARPRRARCGCSSGPVGQGAARGRGRRRPPPARARARRPHGRAAHRRPARAGPRGARRLRAGLRRAAARGGDAQPRGDHLRRRSRRPPAPP